MREGKKKKKEKLLCRLPSRPLAYIHTRARARVKEIDESGDGRMGRSTDYTDISMSLKGKMGRS